MNNEERKKQADILLYKMGLYNYLKGYGEPSVVGSYRMDMMAWNDLDIYVANTQMSIDKLYELTDFLYKILCKI